jgi:hypothetical protein
MALVELKKDPSLRDLKWFGLMFAAFLLVVGAIFRWKLGQPSVARGLWIAAGVVAVLYYAIPPLRKPMFAGWMYATFPIGFIISHVVLAVFYFGILTPVGMFMRIVLKRDPMERQLEPARSSYWVARDAHPEAKRYFRQF